MSREADSDATRGSSHSPKTIEPSVAIRPIRNEDELSSVYRLAHDCFVERGYCQPRSDGKLIHHPHLDRIPQTTVLVATLNDEIVGTNTWTMDGPAGLHVDEDFKEETDKIRQEGRVLAASWRIAIRKKHRHERHIVISLIRETLNQCADMGGQVAVFTFNPRHERVYQRLLNLTTIAHCPASRGLTSPLVLMRLDMHRVPARWFNSHRRSV